MKHRFFPSYLPALVLLLLPLALCLLAGDASAAQSAGIKLPENPAPAYITLGILACSAVLFFTEVIPMPITALLVPVALVLTKVLSSKVAFSFFGDPTVVLFMAMFIVGEGTFVTGFADKIGNLAMRVSHGSQRLLLLSTMIAVGGLSIVLSNTGTVAVCLPMVIAMCISSKIAPSKLLIPMAFASSLGGTISLVGTPPNGIINAMLGQTPGVEPFGFFEFGLIGVPLLLAGSLYFAVIGHRFLPAARAGVQDLAGSAPAQARRTDKMWRAILVFVFVVVMMVTKLRIGDANTMMAEGGIQAADKPGDSPAQHYLDVMGGGHYCNRPELVRKLVSDGPACIQWLNELGVEFDKAPDGTMITTHGGGTSRKRMHA
ncbi:MAG: FAD-binding protein, partial [Desulfovibrio sp.]|nr:FAD-binding protein [Desulfovibrio sp.]